MSEFLTVVTAPTETPVSLDEVKTHLRRDDSDEDFFLSQLINGARNYIERTQGKTLVDTVYDWTIQSFSAEICLPRTPVDSVTSITYADTNGDSQTLAAANYTVSVGDENTKGRIVEAYNVSWPATYGHIDDITIRFTAGFGAAVDVPQEYKQMILLLVEHWDRNRGATVEQTMQSTPFAFDALHMGTKSHGWV